MYEQEIVSAFQDVEMTLIKSMRNTMRRHCNEEYTEGINWTQWQAEMLKGLDEYKKSSAEVLPGYFSTINDEITGAIRDAHAQGGMEQEVEILRAIRDGYEAPSKPSTKRTTQGSFFSVNDKKLNALIKATNSDMKKAETAVLRMANDTYRKTMVKAQMHYNAGASNMWQAVDMATKDFLNQGINCIQYANGNRVNIASYAEMALRTGNKRANLMGQAKKRDEWGIHTVIVSAHGGCCPRCMQWQGNVYIDDVHGAGSAKEAKATGYPLLSRAVAGGLLHPMCKHGVSTYYEGINSKPKTPTKSEKDESLRKYSLEQKQRYYERNYRRNMRLANGTQDAATAATYRGRAGAYKKSLQELCAANPDVLRLDRQRISLRGVLSVDNAGAISVNKRTLNKELVKSSLELPEMKTLLDEYIHGGYQNITGYTQAKYGGTGIFESRSLRDTKAIERYMRSVPAQDVAASEALYDVVMHSKSKKRTIMRTELNIGRQVDELAQGVSDRLGKAPKVGEELSFGIKSASKDTKFAEKIARDEIPGMGGKHSVVESESEVLAFRVKDATRYADISEYSDYVEQEEVLFAGKYKVTGVEKTSIEVTDDIPEWKWEEVIITPREWAAQEGLEMEEFVTKKGATKLRAGNRVFYPADIDKQSIRTGERKAPTSKVKITYVDLEEI